MISCQKFFEILKEKDLTFFTGIPDSTFKDFIKYLYDFNGKSLVNIISCNECESIALAAGYHLSTNKTGIVYMQNSGLGKTINPLTSLCDLEIYSIPILLLIGWRGEPGKKDAPQHKKMGRIMLKILETLEIPYSVLEPNIDNIRLEINKANNYLINDKGPYALIIKRDFFQRYEMQRTNIYDYELTREEAIHLLMNNLTENDIIISTTGYTSREVYEYRENKKKDHFRGFYNIGSMGCASSIGVSIAIQKPEKRIIIFDGDGASIMQMGAFSTIGNISPSNYIHIIFDNHVHETTGCQPSNSKSINFVEIALACGYKYGKIISTKNELLEIFDKIKSQQGPIIIVVRIKMGSRSDLNRPESDPRYYKEQLIKYLAGLK